jgi:hypothetical protein
LIADCERISGKLEAEAGSLVSRHFFIAQKAAIAREKLLLRSHPQALLS